MSVVIVFVILMAAGLVKLQFTADYKIYLGDKNPELLTYLSFENTYTTADSIFFVLQPGEGDIFSNDHLKLLHTLTELAWQIPHSVRVDSIINFQHTKALGDELIVEELVSDPSTLQWEDLLYIRKVALQEPSLVNRLISNDGKTVGVYVTLKFPGTDHTEHLPQSVEYAQNLAHGILKSNQDWRIALSGIALLTWTEIQVIGEDMKFLIPIMYLLIILVMFTLLRSAAGTIVTLLIVTFSAMTAVGISAWLDMKMSATSALAPVVIMTLAIADSIHILLTIFDEIQRGQSKQDAIIESMRINAEPVFLTSLTTSIGFLSLNFSDSPPFNDLGNIAAIGVIAAWFFTITFVPAFMSTVQFSIPTNRSVLYIPMERLGRFIIIQRNRMLWGMIILVGIITVFIPRLELDDRFIKWFDESLDFRRDTDFASENLIGPYQLEYSLPSGEPGGIGKPDYLQQIDNFTKWLRNHPNVTHVSSFSDVMKRVNKSMHSDDPKWYKIPEKRDLAAQYILLYELSLPYGLDLNNQINIDKSASRLTVTLNTISQKEILLTASEIEKWLKDNALPVMQVSTTGQIMMFVHIAERNIRSMLTGTALAFILIATILVIALRNVTHGLISLVPNFLPVIVTFGLWSVFVGHIGIIASIITATSMGLIVDDTVHILSKYSRAKREYDYNTHDAIRYTFSHVGNALWVTTVVLILGFSVLAFSTFRLNSEMGIMTAMTLASALAMDFFLLPPLLMWLDKEKHCICKICLGNTLENKKNDRYL